jgi:hypothetical protein
MAITGGTLAQFAATTSAQLAGVISDETGSGSLVFANTPTLVTPNIGAATGTSLAATGGPVTVRAAATQDAVILTGRAGGTGSFGVTLTPTTLTASRTVTLADGNTTLQAGTMATTGGTLAQFAATTSAQLAGVISDETGSGALVFATSPTINTPTITTSAVIPLVNGGTAASSTLTLQSTSGAGTSDAIIFKTASQSEKMRITSTGNVGIGTTSPAVALDLGGGSNWINGTTSYTNILPSAKIIQIYDSSQSVLNIVSGANTDGGVLGGILFSRSLGQGDAHYNVAGMTAVQKSTGITSGAELLFYTKTNSAPLERMRIDKDGNVLIGYTTSNGAYKLQVNSQIFATNATIATSDRRYKKDIMPIKSGLNVIGKLNPVSFIWKEHDVHQFDSGTQVGFIAQDVQDALGGERYSDCVVKRNQVQLKDGSMEEFYGLSDSKLIPLIVKSIQELNAKLEELTDGKGNMISREVL